MSERTTTNDYPDDIVVPVSAFSWSPARSGLFHCCRRAYFYHYHAATAGGWEPHADPWLKEPRHLKRLRELRGWLTDTLAESAVETLVNRPRRRRADDGKLTETISSDMRRRIARGIRDLRDGAWREDPKRLNLVEFHYGSLDWNALSAKIDADARRLVKALVRSGLAAELAAADQLDWLSSGRPESMSIDGVNAWVRPDFAWTSVRGVVNVVNVTGGRRSVPELESARATLSAMWASARSHRSLDHIAVRSFLPDDEEGHPPRREVVAADRLRGLIHRDAAAMRGYEGDDGLVRESDFTPSPNCLVNEGGACRFDQFCRKRRSPHNPEQC